LQGAKIMFDPEITLQLLAADVTCRECGAIRENTQTGSVCPNGHGKIMPTVADRYVRRYRERLEKRRK